MEDGKPVEGSLYVYAPNNVAPIFFAVAFAASGLCHFWNCYRFKCFKMMGLHPICAMLFSAGYALREYRAFNYFYSNQNLIVYIVSVCLTYISPPLLELANYHVLDRIFDYVPYLSPLEPGRVLSTFGALSALVEGFNALGVSFRSNTKGPQHQQDLGRTLTIAALVLQLVVIASFVVLAGIFHRRCFKANIHAKAVSAPLITMYISTTLILIRCIYRTIEQCGNTTMRTRDLTTLSPILRYEWFFYVFEGTLMLVNSVLWNLRHARYYLPKNSHVYLAQDGKTERERKVRKAGRPWLSTLTFGIFFREKQDNQRFWELDGYSAADRQL